MDQAEQGTLRVEVLARGESTWASNGLRFETEPEAVAYAHDLHSRWMPADKMRVVPKDHPQREAYEPGSEHPDWRT